MMAAALDQGLVQQHRQFSREGYDGHRRHSGLTTMHRLGMRRFRRIWRQRLHDWASGSAGLVL